MKKILAIDDIEINLDLLWQVVNIYFPDFLFLRATSGNEGIEIAKREKPEVILLDILMPGIDGYEVCRQLKANEKTADIPVVFVTAKTNKEDEEKGIKVGAVDYIRKPVTPEEVIKSIREHI